MNYSQEPYHPERQIWVAEEEGLLVGYVYVQGTECLLSHPVYFDHPELPRPRCMISDLYVMRERRGQGAAGERISTLLVRHALRALRVAPDDPVALLMPVREVARTALRQALGSRPLVGYKGFGAPVFRPLEDIIEQSKKYRPRKLSSAEESQSQ